ncbi:MAG: cytochrome c-type biogenesis protein CcmH [Chromatiaceae bacterium]|nr:cytochrome c-type biogenesis protein CcmH [Gammaproteobacteria bacterium]MCP5298306.1 cytochrome c-type biogenesis protein CcmH [Chromatiaceae bacterium]MCP5423154.1 cytochrome c-type biogenesis protein CcmH [Chromatiaceae bacterium]
MFLVVGLLCSTLAFARVEVHEFDTPEQEARYSKLIKELRCLVCQNQNIADSNAELAVDLRRKTYEMVRQDKSEDEITGYMVERYGKFVQYDPPLDLETVLLWSGPFLILLIGVTLLIRTIQRRRSNPTVTVDADRLKAAAALLETERDTRKS